MPPVAQHDVEGGLDPIGQGADHRLIGWAGDEDPAGAGVEIEGRAAQGFR